MSAKAARKPTTEEWLAHQPILKKLWLDDQRTLEGKDGVMEAMSTQHNFIAK